MTTQTVLTDAQFDLDLVNANLLSMNKIKSLAPAAFKINRDGSDDEIFKSVNACLEGANENKGCLIELLFHFEQAGEYDSIKCHPDVYWIAEIVAGNSWTDEVNATYWNEHWDGNFDNLGHTINHCYNEFYPLH